MPEQSRRGTVPVLMIDGPHDRANLRYCNCRTPAHVENCPDCIGFGLQPDTSGKEYWGKVHEGTGKRPRFAHDSSDYALFAGPCPTCGTGVAAYTDGPGMDVGRGRSAT